MPTTVAKPSDACCACSIAWPPSSTCRDEERADSAVVDDAVHGGLGEGVGALVEADRRERDRAVFGDRVLTRRIGADDGGHLLQASDPGEGRVDGRPRGGVRDRAGAGVEDDLIGVPGLGREAALQEVDRPLGAGPGQRKAARSLLPDRARKGEHSHGRHEPGDDHEPTVSHCPTGDCQHLFLSFHEWKICRDCIDTTAACGSQQSLQKFFMCRLLL